MRIPLTWPEGTYGLPMPKEGCPKEKGLTWHAGTRYQDTEDSHSRNQWSSHFNLAWDNKRNDVVMKYCIKTNFKGAGYPLPWPKGKYCIHKKGHCPEGCFIFCCFVFIKGTTNNLFVEHVASVWKAQRRINLSSIISLVLLKMGILLHGNLRTSRKLQINVVGYGWPGWEWTQSTWKCWQKVFKLFPFLQDKFCKKQLWRVRYFVRDLFDIVVRSHGCFWAR